MEQTLHRPGITFSVDEVMPAAKPLRECRTYEAMKETLGGHIESCSDYHSNVIRQCSSYQPLLAAVYIAFSQHRPLVLTPDAVWITIAQGVAHHMTVHGERLRSRLVDHSGKLELTFPCRGWVEGSPENPWAEAFASWAGQIREHVGPAAHDALVCDFSTTGPVELAASQVVLMDTFERYFQYALCCICGIPTVTLEGSPADWQRLAKKAAYLESFELDWWLEHLLPICQQFVRASRGDIDIEHWQGICKLREDYGGDIINGWVARLFPYLRDVPGGPCKKRNPIFETGQGFQTLVAPPGLSRVPFIWRDLTTGRERLMEAIGGLLGVTQDPANGALRPKIGWAVRHADKIDVLLSRLAADHQTFPSSSREQRATYLPPDLAKFYAQTDGAELFGQANRIRIVSANDLERLDWGAITEHLRSNSYPNGHIWYRLANLPDGSWLAINTQPEYPEELRKRYCQSENPFSDQWDCVVAICHCNANTQGKPGMNPVVALSFTQMLERMLDSGGSLDWLDPQHHDLGDAEQYTRRD